MTKINISVISTIKNEEKSIEMLLKSLECQSKVPDEIIVVDGGSTDKSIDIIENFAKNSVLSIKIIIGNGLNIAEGRNLAIKNAKNELIACVDADCKVNINWLENLIKPFEENHDSVDVVSGWYEPYATTEFEKLAGVLLFPKIERVLKRPTKFLPSSRSIAFKKKCWQEVGGYPEDLYTAEDTLFDIKLKKNGCKFEFSKDAVVQWKVRPNFRALFKQYYMYRRGDGHAKLFFGYYWGPKYIIYIVGFFLLILGFSSSSVLLALLSLSLIYLLGHALMVFKKTKIIRSFLIIPIIVLTVDFSGMLGYIVGSLERLFCTCLNKEHNN